MAAHETIDAMHAVVTLDVALPGIVWPWLVTMNMWAKSIGTGVILVGLYMFKNYSSESKELKLPVTLISFGMLSVFLLFTLADLHQPFRMINIFLHPHWSSPITYGAWIASALMAVLSAMIYALYIKKDEALFDKLYTWAFILSIPVTLYTAILMGMSTARELWQTPVEFVQMVLAATLTGSATLLFFKSKFSYELTRDLAVVLFVSATAAFIIYMGEYIFGPGKAEEVKVTLQAIQGGDWTLPFWIGQVTAFIIPAVLTLLSVLNRTTTLLPLAAILAIAGLWLVKHVWLYIPQLLPMS
jgi:protein NrfD